MRIKFWEENYCFEKKYIYSNGIYSKIAIYCKIRGGLQRPTPPSPANPSAAKFTSQGDGHVRTDAQIKFLHYPLRVNKFLTHAM